MKTRLTSGEALNTLTKLWMSGAFCDGAFSVFNFSRLPLYVSASYLKFPKELKKKSVPK